MKVPKKLIIHQMFTIRNSQMSLKCLSVHYYVNVLSIDLLLIIKQR